MKKMSLVDVIGRQYKRVPVLLTPTMVAAIQALVDKRGEGGVKSSNPYTFAQRDSDHKRGTECIRRTSRSCDLRFPERITSTKLRKYLATVSQIFNLSESELGELARHMGHELSVHRQTYPLQDNVIELAKVSRLLIAVEEGKAAECAGQSLDDISLEDFDREENDAEPNEDDEDDNEEDLDLDDVGEQHIGDVESDDEYNSRSTKTTKKKRDSKKEKRLKSTIEKDCVASLVEVAVEKKKPSLPPPPHPPIF